ncbi:MAG: YfhO family protein [Spirochaetia bacterium]|nr:YfhO family protein [Spirochaetia bacterium]
MHSFDRWRSAIPVLLLVSCLAFLYSRSDLVHFDASADLATNTNYDDVSFELPIVQYFHKRLMQGELALWNPYQSAGNPVIGTLQQRLLYPPRVILYALAGLERGQFFEIIFHFLLAVCGTYAMLRSFRLKQPAAFAGALSVMLASEFHYTTFSHNVFATLAWVPVCIWSIRRFLIDPSPSSSVILALAFSMLIYAGYPQFAFYALHLCVAVFLAGVFSFRKRMWRIRARLLALLGFSGLLFATITAPQLISAGEFFGLGIRGAVGLTFEQFGKYGGHPMIALIPQLYAGTATRLYMHVATLMVIGGFALGWMRLPRLRLPILVMLAIAVATALLAMGPGGSPFPQWVYEYYPLGKAFRHPVRALFLLLFPCAFALALLCQGLATFRPAHLENRLSFARISYVLVVALLLAILLPNKTFYSHAFINSAGYMNTFAGDLQRVMPEGSQNRFATITGFQTEPYRRAGLLSNRRSLSDYEPSNGYRYYLFSKLISEQLRNQSASEVWLGDLGLTYADLANPISIRFLQASSVNRVIADSLFWKQLAPGIKQRIQATPELHFSGNIPNSRVANILSRNMNPWQLQLLTGYFRGYDSLFEVVKIDASLPRAYVTNRILFTENPNRAAEKMRESFDPLKETVIEATLESQKHLALSPNNVAPADSFQPVDFISDEPEHILLRVKTKGDSFLVLNDTFFPGWECSINGKPASILPANILFRGVRLTSGDHEIEFKYKPHTLLVALVVSVLSYGLCCIVLILNGLKIFRKRSHK